MKTTILFRITFCLIFSWGVFIQTGRAVNSYNEYPGYFEDFVSPDTNSLVTTFATAATPYSPNGRNLTPKGDLRALIIFVGFGMPYDAMETSNWPAANPALGFPSYMTNTSDRMFYSDTTQFENPTAADGVRNVSRYYYEMSNKKFRFMVDTFEQPVVIDPTGAGGWGVLNRRVLEKIQVLSPNFDWTLYDNRTNLTSDYAFDESVSPPDGKVDFVIIVWRYNPTWVQQPITGMNNWLGSQGGFDQIGTSVTHGNYTINRGYTQCSSGNGIDLTEVLIHEMAHITFYCPHYANANSIIGQYFYGQNGWGTMNRWFSPFSCTNGWERWYLGWTEDIQTSGVNADIKSSADLNSTGEYTLCDFITTGDVLRLKIPNGTAKNQYLWLENHKGTSVFDRRVWKIDGIGQPFPVEPRGIMGYIEAITDDRYATGRVAIFQGGANGIKFLHSKGNYDYTFDPTPITTPPVIWSGNAYFNFHEQEINPISGQGRSEMIRGDFNEDGKIDIGDPADGNTGGSKVDQKTMIMRDGIITHDAMASSAAFKAGDKLSMSSNPCLINRPQYDHQNYKMGNFYLNGISVEFLTDSKVKVRYNDVDIDRNTRYAGFVHLPVITDLNSPDIKILSGITLKIDKSGTPNRHTQTPWGDFVNLTEFVCEANSYFKQMERSKVVVEDSTLLVLENGSLYEIEDGAGLTVRTGSTLMLKAGATLRVKGKGYVDMEAGSRLCVDPASTVYLEDTLSVINLRPGSSLGKGTTNSFSDYNTCNCTSSISQIKDSGQGKVNLFDSYPLYIQNTTINTKHYYYGSEIKVGRDVIPDSNPPRGDVILEPGSDVIFDASEDVIFEGGFEAKKGATFEAR